MSGNKKQIVLSFGGNHKNTKSCFKKSISQLEKRMGSILLTSQIYESEAWGFKKKTDNFLNQVVVLETDRSPEQALIIAQEIEVELGRKTKSNNQVYQDRPIDIDLLFYEDKILKKPTLTIPHYLIQDRKFILIPLEEIMPEFIHPVLKKSMKELLLSCKDKNKVSPIGSN